MAATWMRASFIALSLALASSCQTMAPTAPQAQPLDPQLAAIAARSGAPGLVAAVYRDGRLTELYTWGGADCAGQGAVNANADFEIGSISKHMTAVGLLRLWERGRVDLDANVGTYLTDIPETWKRVTLRQLLTHTSGVPDYEEAGGYGVYETTPTAQQVFDIVRDRPLDFEPGSQWSYSNTGYFLLSLVIERVSGMKFGDYMRERVFAPLHMDHTFESGYGPAGAPIAQGCRPGEGANAARIPVRPISEASTYGAGGILSTANDWAKWYDALNSGHLLSPRSMQAMFTPVTLPDGTQTGYAFGMEVDDFRGEPRRGHSGQTQGFVADYASFPDRHLAFLILANQYDAGISSLMEELQIRAMPDLSYDRVPAGVDPDPARTAAIERGIRQLMSGQEPLDVLDTELRTFALDPANTSQRERLRTRVGDMARFEFLRDEPPPPNGGYARALYRVTRADGDTSYFVAGWRDGKLHRLRWYDD